MKIAAKPLIMAAEIAGLALLSGFIKQENRVVPLLFALAQKQKEFIQRIRPKVEVTRELLPPASEESPKVSNASQAVLPLCPGHAVKPKQAFVWDNSQGIA